MEWIPGITKKWAFTGKVELEKFKSEINIVTRKYENTEETRYDFYSVDEFVFNFAVGSRYYFNPMSKSKLFVDVTGGISVGGESTLYEGFVESTDSEFYYFRQPSATGTQINLFGTVGVGCTISKRIGMEIRAYSPRTIAESDDDYTISYSRIGINLRYGF